MNEDWLNKIHKQMADYEIAEPENLWESIENKHIKPSSAGRHRHFIVMASWLKRGAAVAAMIAAAVYLCHDVRTEHEITTPCTSPNNYDVATTRTLIAGSSEKAFVALNDKPTHLTENNVNYRQENVEKERIDNEQDNTDLTSQKDDNQTALCKTTDNSHTQVNAERTIKEPKSGIYRKNMATLTNNDKQKRFAFSAFSSGGSGHMSSQYYRNSSGVCASNSGNAAWEDNPVLGFLLLNQGLETKKEIRHRLPIRAGISFTYSINKHLGIESGLSYTNLNSDVFEGSDANYYTGKQILHYIGIPLNLKYNIFTWKRLMLYVSVGGLAEKCISAKIDKEFTLENKTQRKESENIDGKPMQWSVNAAAGIQLNIVNSLSLYAEPGISYYFNDGSAIQTIYKEKPLNFNLNFGIRFTFGKQTQSFSRP
jgi:hypothetical protein